MLNTACFVKTLSIPECDLSEQEKTFRPQILYYKKKQRRFDSIFSTRFIGLPCKFKNALLTRLRKAPQLASSLPPLPRGDDEWSMESAVTVTEAACRQLTNRVLTTSPKKD